MSSLRDRSFFTWEGGLVEIGGGPPKINGRKRVGYAKIFVKAGVGHAKITVLIYRKTKKTIIA
jgi:hypothetical protein